MSRSFEQSLARAVAAAAAAPSSHNSQPWGLAVVESDEGGAALDRLAGRSGGRPGPRLVAALDRDRRLRTLPFHDAEMAISVGVYLESILWHLAGDGWRSRPIWVREAFDDADPPLPGLPPAWMALAAVEVEPGEPVAAGGRRSDGRATNRAPYEDRPVEAAVLDGLRSPRCQLDGDGAVAIGVRVVDDREAVRSAGRFAARHAGRDFSDRDAYAETYRYFLFGAREIAEAERGLPIPQLLGPMGPLRRTACRIGLHPRSMVLLEHLGVVGRLGRQLGDLFGLGPVLVAFSVPPGPGPHEFLVGGGVLLDFWERVHGAGLALHPLSILVQHDDLRQGLAAELGLEGEPYFFCRIGWPTGPVGSAPRARDPWRFVVRL